MTKLRMDIPASQVATIARIFQEEGLEVMWEGPTEEQAGGEGRIVHVRFYLKGTARQNLGAAAYEAALEAVRKIHEQYPRATIGEVEQDDSSI